MVNWLVAAGAAGRWLLVGWLAGFAAGSSHENVDFVAGAGFGDEVQISWRGGVGGGAQRPPQQHTRSEIKQMLAAKMRLRSADTFNRLIALLLAWLVPVLLFCCGSWRLRLWLLSLQLVLVAVVVGRSELEHELVHPPLARSTQSRASNSNPNSNSNGIS